jgi:hypothetical protein
MRHNEDHAGWLYFLLRLRCSSLACEPEQAACLQADRAGRGGECADAYAESDLFVSNAALMGARGSDSGSRNSLTTQQELAVRRETVTPWYWGCWVLLKVLAPFLGS